MNHPCKGRSVKVPEKDRAIMQRRLHVTKDQSLLQHAEQALFVCPDEHCAHAS